MIAVVTNGGNNLILHHIKFVGIVCVHSSVKLLDKVINDRIYIIKTDATIIDSTSYNLH